MLGRSLVSSTLAHVGIVVDVEDGLKFAYIDFSSQQKRPVFEFPSHTTESSNQPTCMYGGGAIMSRQKLSKNPGANSKCNLKTTTYTLVIQKNRVFRLRFSALSVGTGFILCVPF